MPDPLSIGNYFVRHSNYSTKYAETKKLTGISLLSQPSSIPHEGKLVDAQSKRYLHNFHFVFLDSRGFEITIIMVADDKKKKVSFNLIYFP